MTHYDLEAIEEEYGIGQVKLGPSDPQYSYFSTEPEPSLANQDDVKQLSADMREGFIFLGIMIVLAAIIARRRTNAKADRDA